MRLKKIELLGFKSFAERVPLNFDSDVIALVGPNGCGKSNIVDAILWVLGEQSAKSLRADKMGDILFAGADDLKPAPFAEVSLTLTGLSDFDEITLSRRLYRDGEMRYLINRQEVRLKDVNDLLLGSGIGKHAFFVFEQGKIDEVINLTPEKRRAIFEETAGISRFLQKRRETLNELSDVEKNFHRLNDLHGEVSKQLVTIQNQAERAKGYQEKKKSLIALEQAIFLFKREELNRAVTSLEKESESSSQTFEAITHRLALLEKSLMEIKEREEGLGKEFTEAQKRASQVESSLKLHEVELKGVKEALAHLVDREKKALSSQKKIAENVGKDKGEEERDLLKTLEEETTLTEKERVEAEKACEAIEKELTLLLSKERGAQKALLEAVQKENLAKNTLQSKIVLKEGLFLKAKEVSEKISQNEQLLQELEKKREEKRATVDLLSQEIEKINQEMLSHEEKGEKLKCELENQKGTGERLQKEATEKSAEVRAQLLLQQAHDGFTGGTKLLLKESENQKSLLFGKVQPLYKYADEAILKFFPLFEYMYEETLVVPSQKDLSLLFDFASTKKVGEFSVVLQEDAHALLQKRLSSVNDLNEVFVSERGLECLLPGVFVDQNRVFFFRGEKKSIHISRESAIQKGKKALDLIHQRQKEFEEEFAKCTREKQLWDEQKKTWDEKKRKKEMTLLQENFYLQHALEEYKNTRAVLKRYEEEKKKHDSFVKELEVVLIKMAKEGKEASLECDRIRSESEIIEREIKETRVLFDERKRDVAKTKKRRDEVLGRLFTLKEKIKIRAIKAEEERKEKERIEGELKEISRLKERYLEKGQKSGEEREELEKIGEEIGKLVIDLEKKLSEERGSKKIREEELVNEKKKSREIEKEKHHLDLKLAEKRVALQAQNEQNKNNSEDFQNLPPLEMPLKEAEEKVYRLKYELESAKAINLAAIDECEVHQKRFTELDTQLKDIKEARQGLEAIIAKLEGESRRLLKSTFESVRQNFQKNFQILFQGGEADLVFTGSSDFLDKGIEIIAKPPGKRMRSLSLLSGGERCLTTLALLFALFAVKPAPFCILDEVDAPLDEANVERFTNLLKEFVPQTQFVIVTHNKKTMGAADILVGVSMEKKGVSKLVSLAFAKNKTLKTESSIC